MKTTLKEGEQVILSVKKHWATLVLPFASLLFIFFLLFYSPHPLQKLLRAIAPYAVAASAAYIVYSYYIRKTSLIVVTNFRVIREWGVYSYNVKESLLSMINNITVRQDPLGIVFGYGDIQLQTAAEYGTTTDKFVTDPKKLQITIFQAQYAYKAQGQSTDSRMEAAPQLSGDDTKECPFCAEIIKKKAKVCRFCGKTVPAESADDTITLEKTVEAIPPPEAETGGTVRETGEMGTEKKAVDAPQKVYKNFRDFQRDDLASLSEMKPRRW